MTLREFLNTKLSSIDNHLVDIINDINTDNHNTGIMIYSDYEDDIDDIEF